MRARTRHDPGLRPAPTEQDPHVFFFFSNRLGCLGSLLLSLAVTAILILALNR